MTSGAPADRPPPPRGALASKVVVGLVVAMAVAVTVAAATTLPARLEVRALIRDLESPDLGKAHAAYERLRSTEPRRLRPEHSAFIAALGVYAGRFEAGPGDDDPILALLTDLARKDSALVRPALASPRLKARAEKALRTAGSPGGL